MARCRRKANAGVVMIYVKDLLDCPAYSIRKRKKVLLSDGTSQVADFLVDSHVLGVGTMETLAGDATAVAVHDAKSLLVYQHLEDVVSEYNCIYGQSGQFFEGLFHVNMYQELVILSGIDGSCVIRQLHQHDRPNVETLYNFLCWLCRERHVHLFKCAGVRVYSNIRNCDAVIVFKNTIETKRFLMKLYMDSLGGSNV